MTSDNDLFKGKYRVEFRTWKSDGETCIYHFGNRHVMSISVLHLGSGLFRYKDDPIVFGDALSFELHDDELCLLDIPPRDTYFTAWYEYE